MKFRKLKAVKLPAPSLAYHSSWIECLPSIIKKGLLPGQKNVSMELENKVHHECLFFTDKDGAYQPVGEYAYREILLRFPWPRTFQLDKVVDGHPEYKTMETIPPKGIQIWDIKRQRWIPIMRIHLLSNWKDRLTV